MAPEERIPTVLRHAFTILTAVGEAGPSGADATELHIQTGLNIRTVYRHLASLRTLGMIAGAGDGTRYRLGPTIAGLATLIEDAVLADIDALSDDEVRSRLAEEVA